LPPRDGATMRAGTTPRTTHPPPPPGTVVVAQRPQSTLVVLLRSPSLASSIPLMCVSASWGLSAVSPADAVAVVAAWARQEVGGGVEGGGRWPHAVGRSSARGGGCRHRSQREQTPTGRQRFHVGSAGATHATLFSGRCAPAGAVPGVPAAPVAQAEVPDVRGCTVGTSCPQTAAASMGRQIGATPRWTVANIAACARQSVRESNSGLVQLETARSLRCESSGKERLAGPVTEALPRLNRPTLAICKCNATAVQSEEPLTSAPASAVTDTSFTSKLWEVG